MMTYLQKVDPDQNMRRFYRATVAPTLFGEWALIREWGRIGSPRGQRMEEWFNVEAKALDAMRYLISTKQRKGYSDGI
jgi:predicted DNA-binding WGR domain protein